MSISSILKDVEEYYTARFKRFGPTFKGVDWSSTESQWLRFEQLLKLCDFKGHFTINDYGCGYGALFEYMTKKYADFEYYGCDLSKEMIVEAKNIHKNYKNCHFFVGDSMFNIMDYIIASGIFNVKIDNNCEEWESYIFEILARLNNLCRKGFSFNMLTKHADKERMRNDLYYADPCFYFDYCKKRFSKKVSLLHDYDLYEFTVIVRK